MNSSEIPSSVKSPLSLQADYADPKLYGWASIIVGVLALFLAIPMLFIPGSLVAVIVVTGIGALSTALGVWMVKRGE